MATEEKVEQSLAEIQQKIQEGALYIVGNSKDITSLQEWQVRQNGTLGEIKECLVGLASDINRLQVEMVAGKPSWVTLAIISLLSSVAVGAIMFGIRMGK